MTFAGVLITLCLSGQASQGLLSLDQVLAQVQKAGGDLTTYQARIEYTLRQPLLDCQTVRTGMIYYQRGQVSSSLRVSLQTLQQDQDKPYPHREEFIFDGVWLTHIDYQVKSVTKRQLTEPNQPKDPFELAGQEFPVVGFVDINQLSKEFMVELITSNTKGQTYQLLFRPLPQSRFSKQYRRILIYLDERTWLAQKVEAESTEADIYVVVFLQPRLNQPIDPTVFQIKPPPDFGPPQVIPLEHDPQPTGTVDHH